MHIAPTAVSLGDGIEHEIEPADATAVDVYALPAGTVPQLPRSLDEATGLLAGSEMARDWPGADFVAHYAEMKRAELDAQARAVTDWEIARSLETL